ncbi:MAG: sodium:proton antiporter [Eubacteriales bacterium]
MIQYFAIGLVLVGIYGLLTQRNAIKLVVALNIFEVGLNVFIVSIGFVKDGLAPILTSNANSSSLMFVDPLPHALVLTSIVIGVGVTALALALAKKMHNKYGTYDIDEMGGE